MFNLCGFQECNLLLELQDDSDPAAMLQDSGSQVSKQHAQDIAPPSTHTYQVDAVVTCLIWPVMYGTTKQQEIEPTQRTQPDVVLLAFDVLSCAPLSAHAKRAARSVSVFTCRQTVAVA